MTGRIASGARNAGGRGLRNPWRGLIVLSIAIAVLATFSSPAGAQSRSTSREVRLTGEMSPRLPELTRDGHAATDRRLTVTITLRRAHEAAFQRFLASVTNPRSASYQHFLSQRQLTDRYGPTRSSYGALSRWLEAEGLRIVSGSANRLTITAAGALWRVERAFGVRIDDFRESGRRARAVYANTGDPVLPARLASSVEAVSGLSDIGRPARQLGPTCLQSLGGVQCTSFVCGLVSPSPSVFFSGRGLIGAIVNLYLNVLVQLIPRPILVAVCGGMMVGVGAAGAACAGLALSNPSVWTTNPECSEISNSILGGLTRRGRGVASQVREAEHRSPRTTSPSNPQKIGLLEFDTFHPSDVADWESLVTGDTVTSPSGLSEVNVNGGVATPGAGEAEVLLDVDASMLFDSLPGTRYVVYDAPPSTSFETMFNAMINDGDTVISNSWSECEDQVSAAEAESIDSILAQAAASGISVFNGSGDSGGSCLDGSPNTIGVPADSPHATAVGGTTATPSDGYSYGTEAWWNGASHTPPSGAGGFGVSRYFNRPSYQNGFTTSSKRSVPDVVTDADPAEGMEICQADAGGCPSGGSYGGTSVAAPVWAAVTAFLNDSLGHNIGEANPVLYKLAGTAAFHSPSSMGSDFAHVGLGSFDFEHLREELSGSTGGAVSPSLSIAVAAGDSSDEVPADGSSSGYLTAILTDAGGYPVAGKTVTITANGGSDAIVSPASAVTNSDGQAVFTITDATVQDVTFTVKDTTDGVTLYDTPTLTFVEPTATGATITASPTDVDNDGTSQSIVSVYLQNALGQPAAGKSVTLSENGASATITPAGSNTAGDTAVTGSDGYARFTATDSSKETVNFTAIDTTDGSLPVPGSALVNFEPSGASSCSDAAPTAASGYSTSPFVSGLSYNAQPESFGSFTLDACSGPLGPAFNSSGVAYIPDAGQIYTFGPSGGSVTSAPGLPQTDFNGELLGGLAFDSSGHLFATLYTTTGNFADPQLLELDPNTGATIKHIADAYTGLVPCPSIAIDPVSSDVFEDDGCTGFDASNELVRVSNPLSANPTVTDYADLGSQSAGMAFAPDGTLYVAVRGSDKVVSVTGTNAAQPATVTTVATLPNSPSSVAIAATNSSGQATALYVGDFSGNITRLDLTQDPATQTVIATSNGGLVNDLVVGPDGCLYDSGVSTLEKVTGPGCDSANAGPEIALAQSSGSFAPPTGSAVGLTATLANVSNPSGIPVRFTITGPNLDARLATANASGQATASYSGVFQGIDTITASAVVNGTTVTSAPVQVHWEAGKDTTFLDLNTTRQAGPVGSPVAISAVLDDVADTPPAGLAGQTVILAVGGQTCTAQTNASGEATCELTPESSGLLAVGAQYAGTNRYAASTASGVFVAGSLGLETVAPINTVRPRITGTVKKGKTLSCSAGSWSNFPLSYSYQWNRDGTPIQGATHSTYKVVALDEGSALTCSVTALNAVGKSDPATSRGVKVPVPHVKGCPAATGKIAGTKIGLVRLGMTRKQALKAYKRSSNRGFEYKTFFCLTPEGVRVGYGSPLLLKSLSAKQRPKYSGRVVWISTSNPVYAVKGVRAGATLAAARKRLKVGKAIKIGLNDWYLARDGASTAVLKVRKGQVQEIGIADKALTKTRKAQRTLMSSFD